jgi:hypothetical protein
MSADSAAEGLLKTLSVHFDPFIRNSGAIFTNSIRELFEDYQHSARPDLTRGEFVILTRRLLRRIESKTSKEIVWILMQLVRADDDAMFPYQIVLRERPKTKAMRKAATATRRATEEYRRYKRDQAIYYSVIQARKAGYSLDESIAKIASGDWGIEGGWAFKPQCYSKALVKKVYLAHDRAAKRSGFVIANRHSMFAKDFRMEPRPQFRGPGRPKKSVTKPES